MLACRMISCSCQLLSVELTKGQSAGTYLCPVCSARLQHSMLLAPLICLHVLHVLNSGLSKSQRRQACTDSRQRLLRRRQGRRERAPSSST